MCRGSLYIREFYIVDVGDIFDFTISIFISLLIGMGAVSMLVGRRVLGVAVGRVGVWLDGVWLVDLMGTAFCIVLFGVRYGVFLFGD